MEEVSTLDLCINFHDDTCSIKPSKSQTYFHGEELMVATPPQDAITRSFTVFIISLPVTTGGRYELRGKLIYRDVQGGAIIMSSKFEADWMKYVGVRATRMYMASTP
ncbi:Hypothetical predicted protein, partial [Scomber scombrus]